VATDANEFMAQVHNSKKRMPTILNEDLAWEWMFGKLPEQRITEIAKTQYPAELMEVCTIARDFQTAWSPRRHLVMRTCRRWRQISTRCFK